MSRIRIAGLVVLLMGMTNGATYWVMSERIAGLEKLRRYDGIVENPTRPEFEVVNAHEHLYKREHLEKYLEAAETTGIRRTIFMASSAFTLLGSGGAQDDLTDWNTWEIISVSRSHRERVIPFCTIHPDDPQKLERLKRYVSEGARGLKLYTGHGQFHHMPLDDARMDEIYAYCAEGKIPIIWHVRFDRFGHEFRRVMEKYPEMTVIVPHFGVMFYRPESSSGLATVGEMLEVYPNLYIDTSFGTRSILVQGLEIVSEHHEVFREFFERYQDRIVFGTDMVVTGNQEKTEEWIEAVIRACRDMLEKDRYHFFFAAKGSPHAYAPANNLYGELRGLNLPDEILRKIYETNIARVLEE